MEEIKTNEVSEKETLTDESTLNSQHEMPTQEVFNQKRFYLAREIWGFFKVRKKWWLLPIILMTLLVGILIVFGQSSAVSPFVYALF